MQSSHGSGEHTATNTHMHAEAAHAHAHEHAHEHEHAAHEHAAHEHAAHEHAAYAHVVRARGASEASASGLGRIARVPSLVLRLAIRGYQVALSPLLPPACRYYPTCSNYAVQAIEKYGALRGGWMAARRIGRCHPFAPGGYDPVP